MGLAEADKAVAPAAVVTAAEDAERDLGTAQTELIVAEAVVTELSQLVMMGTIELPRLVVMDLSMGRLT